MSASSHLFGGDWTAEKLERVRKYLVAYATIMKEKRFRFAYIDAFAGTGYRTTSKAKRRRKPYFLRYWRKTHKSLLPVRRA